MGCSGSKESEPGKPVATSGNPSAPEPQKDAALNGGEDDAPVALKLTAKQLASIQELFAQFDIDGQGKLPLANFSQASLKVGPHESGILEKLKEMDFDSDGFITKDVRAARVTHSACLGAGACLPDRPALTRPIRDKRELRHMPSAALTL